MPGMGDAICEKTALGNSGQIYGRRACDDQKGYWNGYLANYLHWSHVHELWKRCKINAGSYYETKYINEMGGQFSSLCIDHERYRWYARKKIIKSSRLLNRRNKKGEEDKAGIRKT